MARRIRRTTVGVSLSEYAGTFLPHPAAPLRAGEPLGAQRDVAVLASQIAAGAIRVTAPGRARAIEPSDFVAMEAPLNRLIGADWSVIRNVRVRLLRLPKPEQHTQKTTPRSAPEGRIRAVLHAINAECKADHRPAPNVLEAAAMVRDRLRGEGLIVSYPTSRKIAGEKEFATLRRRRGRPVQS